MKAALACGAVAACAVLGIGREHAVASSIPEETVERGYRQYFVERAPVKCPQPGVFCTPFEDLPKTRENAIAIQTALVRRVERSGRSVVGYKVGFTGGPPLPWGATGAIVGRIFEGDLAESPAAFEPGTFVQGIAEAEVAVRIGADVPITVVSLEELLPHIEAILPSIECPDFVFAVGLNVLYDAFDWLDLFAFDAIARRAVLGTPIPFDAATASLDAPITATIFHDGSAVSSGTTTLGDRLRPVLEVQRFLAADGGRTLRGGDVVFTGFWFPPVPFSDGEIEVEFSAPLGPVSFTAVGENVSAVRSGAGRLAESRREP